MSEGRAAGRGVALYSDGSRYSGEWLNGEFLGSPNQQKTSFVRNAAGLREIPLRKAGGVFVAPVTINGMLTLGFTLDSGAADVSLPADVVMTLLRTKTLLETDFLGKRFYTLADGTKIPSHIVRIKSLMIGGLEVQNVTASISAVAAPPLLGQSFLGKLGRWSIDNQRQMMVIESADTQ